MCKRGFFGTLVIKLIVALVTLAGIAISGEAQAQESLGTLGVSGIFLEPRFVYYEPSRGSFEAGRSFLGVTWTREPNLAGVLKVGSRSLIGTPARYGKAPVDQLALIEGYAQIDTVAGLFRAGLVPIAYSLEGGDSEERLRLPRSLLFEQRAVNLRDYGASYHISHQGLYSDFAIHNGEGGTDLDNRVWFTFRAGFQNGRALKAGVSGSTGSTTPQSTNPTGTGVADPNAGYDITKSAKVRLANLFAEATWERVTFTTEMTAGDVRQDAASNELRAGHLDAEWDASDKFSYLARYDYFDPSTATTDRIEEYMAGIAVKSVYENSILYLFGSKQKFENNPNDVHRVMLIWRMTPVANSFRSPI